jgi:hypothetical protein
MLKYLGMITQPSGETGVLGVGVFVVLKTVSTVGSYMRLRILRY